MTDVLGVLAGISGVVFALAPLAQVRAVRRAGSSREVSIAYFVALLVNVALWLTYGLVSGDGPIIVANALAVATTAATVAVLVRYRRPARAREPAGPAPYEMTPAPASASTAAPSTSR